MRQLMADNRGHPLLVGRGALFFVVQEVGFPVGDKTPMLHGPGDEVGDGSHVLLR